MPEEIQMTVVGGVQVELDVLRIAEAIHEYDPNLRVQFLNEAAAVGDAPFRVIEHCRDGVDRVAFLAWELDGRLLERVMKADCAKRDLDAIMTKQNRAAKDEVNRRYREQMEEAHEIAHAVMRSRKSKYTVKDPNTGELLVFTD
jgi:hypothetical protein